MLPGYHNFTIAQGADFIRTIVWADSDGVAYDLTNYTAAMKIKTLKSGGTEIASWTSAAGDLVITAVSGSIVINVAAAATAALDFVSAFYDLELTHGVSGTVTRLLEGRVFLNKEVTV